MRKAIEAQYPEHGIFGEEYGHLRPEAPWQWILDPIDGTKSFVTGLPIFGTLVALTHEHQPVIGVIDQPVTRDRWLGAPGRPTTCNGQPARTSTRSEEHTSELQSLMRTSYAVFCLKKKTKPSERTTQVG